VTFTLKPEDGSTLLNLANCPWGSLANLDGLIGRPAIASRSTRKTCECGQVVFVVFKAPDSVPQAAGAAFTAARNITIEGKSDTLSTSQTLSCKPAGHFGPWRVE